MAEKPWDGRFSEKTDKSVEAFTASIAYDRRLYPYDIAGSIAHCRMLAKVGVITDEEASQLVEGLGTIKRELDHGKFVFDDSLEDIHMHIEARLLQVAGKVAQKLHTARSRNDQVALDVRMYLREETRQTIDLLKGLRTVLVDLAEAHADVAMPGYTHTQRAQPVLFAHHMLAYYEMFSRDQQRFGECLTRINVMPLGAAALAGTTYPIDRAYTAELLDFPAVSANSMDAVSDRDFALEFLSAASICMVHLSRLSEELVLWSTSEFGFITLSDAFATGSSIMPQKKNPDIPEIVRGKTGRVVGALMALITLMKSLPMAYNRDMQEDKEPLFDAVDTLKACLSINAQMLPRITVNRDTMRQAASVGFLNATDMADYLVGQGMPFRKAHDCVGKAVAFALEKGKELDQLTLDELKPFSQLIKPDLFDHLTLEHMIDRRQSLGGTATDNVRQALAEARKALAAGEAA
ncbi:argininosuccinate lyase [Desulfosarcina ovata subsp. sediminis]|uniref:Argininosuccinate lyase n=1 Tax=Desulfosarcina ovata subsp. sediminis TaxID=885957 RepID=A0A5K7ZL21_9BACT|nr:argininosuccinate lyase [Desulfosarcina ovata]BBO81746.1 argininosuccinate lyase [Desulfosarcina ovata subsp. sediminis]